jgi:hypothetical protein
MSPLQTLIRAARIKGRTCPKCEALMLLFNITTVPLNFEQHAFKCIDCNHVEMAMVEGQRSGAIAA